MNHWFRGISVAAVIALAGCQQSSTSDSSSGTTSSTTTSEVAASAAPAPTSAPATGSTPLSSRTTASGLKIDEVLIGTGLTAQKGKMVSVHYTGWLPGQESNPFDSSVSKGQPYGFVLGTQAVIAGWDEGLEGMKVGGKRRLTVPPDLAYGARGYPPVIPPGATLIFDVELMDVR